MDFLLIRRRQQPDPPAPFHCACGDPIVGWNPPFAVVAKCTTCERPEYHLLRNEVTASDDARELVVAARGVVVPTDRAAFEAQKFHVVSPPTGARFFPDVPSIVGELTNEDGSLKVEPISN